MSNVELKRLLARQIGEMYKVQNHLGIAEHDEAVIHGLVNGDEWAINQELLESEWISEAASRGILDKFADVFDARTDRSITSIRGFEDWAWDEHKVMRTGVLKLMEKWCLMGRFHDVILRLTESDQCPPSEYKLLRTVIDRFASRGAVGV